MFILTNILVSQLDFPKPEFLGPPWICVYLPGVT